MILRVMQCLYGTTHGSDGAELTTFMVWNSRNIQVLILGHVKWCWWFEWTTMLSTTWQVVCMC